MEGANQLNPIVLMTYISELPKVVQGVVFKNQKAQGNTPNALLTLITEQPEGNFAFSNTPEGLSCWLRVCEEDYSTFDGIYGTSYGEFPFRMQSGPNIDRLPETLKLIILQRSYEEEQQRELVSETLTEKGKDDLSCAFNWKETKEGWSVWHGVAHNQFNSFDAIFNTYEGIDIGNATLPRISDAVSDYLGYLKNPGKEESTGTSQESEPVRQEKLIRDLDYRDDFHNFFAQSDHSENWRLKLNKTFLISGSKDKLEAFARTLRSGPFEMDEMNYSTLSEPVLLLENDNKVDMVKFVAPDISDRVDTDTKKEVVRYDIEVDADTLPGMFTLDPGREYLSRFEFTGYMGAVVKDSDDSRVAKFGCFKLTHSEVSKLCEIYEKTRGQETEIKVAGKVVSEQELEMISKALNCISTS